MEKTVLLLVPPGAMTEEEKAYYVRLYPQMEFEIVDPANPLKNIPARVREGIEIVAGRGNTSAEISQAFPDLHVVEIPITAHDVFRSFNTAEYRGRTIAVITSKANIIGLDVFSEIYDIRILNYQLTPYSSLEYTIHDAVSKGAALIMGGHTAASIAKRMGFPAVTFLLGQESMQHVFNEVRQVQAAIEIEATRQGFLNELMDNILEGVVAINTDNRITAINAVAERILGLSGRVFLGECASKLGEVFARRGGNKQSEEIATIRGNTVMVNRIPIMHGQRTLATIFTMHERRKVEKMENTIRKEVYAKDHVVRYTFADVLGTSAAIRRAMADAQSYAGTDSNILVTGESGCGKEVFAQSIHHASPRGDRPFVAVNCAALPNELLQSELFGYVEGAFTGALRKGKVGLFEIAHNGTIFLDEISEMDYVSQGILLRVVQERYVVRLGSHKPIAINTRIIAATNKNLSALVQEGKFRKDLYYRLNVLALEIPPLRQRGRDIASMMLYFLRSIPSPFQDSFQLRGDAEHCLETYSWPGNIRELHNVAERIAVTAKSPEVSRQQLEWAMQLRQTPVPRVAEERIRARRHRSREQLEDIQRALATCGGNLSEAARQLGINRTTLWRRMKRNNLEYRGDAREHATP